MDLLSLILIGIGISIDSLAVSITTGAYTKQIRLKYIFKTALFMAVFQGLMPLIGWLIGSRFKNIVESYDHWIAFILLLAVGGKLIYDGLIEGSEDKSEVNMTNNLILAGMALATSIDALIIGVGFGFIDINIWLAVFIIGITTFIFSVAGVYIGKKIGAKINKGIDIFGGLVLIGLGVKILIEHIYFS